MSQAVFAVAAERRNHDLLVHPAQEEDCQKQRE